MKTQAKPAGFTLTEIVLVTAIIGVLVALVWTVLGTARKGGYRTTCMSHLRQMGIAYQMYVADNEHHAFPAIQTVLAPYLKDKRVLFCPEDVSRLAASSYIYTASLPPNRTQSLNGAADVDPNVVLIACDIHATRKVTSVKNDDPQYGSPAYPHHFVLRANGAVERVPLGQIRRVWLSGTGRPAFTQVYPREPGYEQGKRIEE